MSLVQRCSRVVNRWVEQIVWLLGVGMALVVAAQVFCRYVLNGSLFWSEELARYMLVWLTLLGATVASYRAAHPGVDLLVQRLPPNLQRAAAWLVHFLTCTLAVVMVVAGVRFAWFVRMQVSPALAIPKWLVFAVLPISGTILLLHGLRGLSDCRGRKTADDAIIPRNQEQDTL